MNESSPYDIIIGRASEMHAEGDLLRANIIMAQAHKMKNDIAALRTLVDELVEALGDVCRGWHADCGAIGVPKPAAIVSAEIILAKARAVKEVDV